jgi:acyl homoserine lactone synthase
MVDCVSISTSHLFGGNPIYEQHRLRHECIVQRQSWNVPTIRNMEYDQYDNPAACYLVWRDKAGTAAALPGFIRLIGPICCRRFSLIS